MAFRKRFRARGRSRYGRNKRHGKHKVLRNYGVSRGGIRL